MSYTIHKSTTGRLIRTQNWNNHLGRTTNIFDGGYPLLYEPYDHLYVGSPNWYSGTHEATLSGHQSRDTIHSELKSTYSYNWTYPTADTNTSTAYWYQITDGANLSTYARNRAYCCFYDTSDYNGMECHGVMLGSGRNFETGGGIHILSIQAVDNNTTLPSSYSDMSSPTTGANIEITKGALNATSKDRQIFSSSFELSDYLRVVRYIDDYKPNDDQSPPGNHKNEFFIDSLTNSSGMYNLEGVSCIIFLVSGELP